MAEDNRKEAAPLVIISNSLELALLRQARFMPGSCKRAIYAPFVGPRSEGKLSEAALQNRLNALADAGYLELDKLSGHECQVRLSKKASRLLKKIDVMEAI